jgi:hypothetical protein
MKFRTIFWIFNIVLLFSFLAVGFMPIPLLGMEITLQFWSDYWYLFLAFLLGIVVINVLFLQNFRLFQLMEEEDWDKLRAYLYEKMQKGRLDERDARNFLNTALMTNKPQLIPELREHLKTHRPQLLEKLALYLGLPFFVQQDLQASEEYYQRYLESSRAENRDWIRWLYAFSRAVQKKTEGTKEAFADLVGGAKDPIVRLLSLFLLENFQTSFTPEEEKLFQSAKEALQAQYSPSAWKKVLEKASSVNILILLVKNIISDAYTWLTGDQAELAVN